MVNIINLTHPKVSGSHFILYSKSGKKKKKKPTELHYNVNAVEVLNTRQQTGEWGQVSAAVGNETHAEKVD